MANQCPHQPQDVHGPIGMYHCPECGEMVIAGMEHPDYDLVFTEEDYAVFTGQACFVGNHGANCERGQWTDVGEAIALGLACSINNHRDDCLRSACDFLALGIRLEILGARLDLLGPEIDFMEVENAAVITGLACWIWDRPKSSIIEDVLR